jgi:hypothetical protein
MKIILLLIGLLNFAFANMQVAPPNINIKGKDLVFVDIQNIDVKLTYNIATQTAMAVSTIKLRQDVPGHIIFDLVPKTISASLNGKNVPIEKADLKDVSEIKYVDKKTDVGEHILIITNQIETNITFNSSFVKSAFWMSDLSDRRYIEQYLPTNLEYDQYQMSMHVKVLGAKTKQVLYTNGDVEEIANNEYLIKFRKVYTASSFYFHLTKAGLIPELKKNYTSIDNRVIPVTVYTDQSTTRFMNHALKVLAELEKDYGPFPHDKVVIYGAGMGGMEHCGATITSLSALGHELIHSYFARGVMPAHGNAGWVDEAIASWRDSDYANNSGWFMSRSEMAGHSIYRRTTDRDAYSKGKKFLGYLNKYFEDENKQSLKVFLREFFEKRAFKPFKTHEFQSAMENFYNISLKEKFDKYVYGIKGVDQSQSKSNGINPMHPHLSKEDLLNLL